MGWVVTSVHLIHMWKLFLMPGVNDQLQLSEGELKTSDKVRSEQALKLLVISLQWGKSNIINAFFLVLDISESICECPCKCSLTQFSICVFVSNTLDHFSSFVTFCLSWFLSPETDRCSGTESGKATPSAQLSSIYPKQLWYSNITTVHCVCLCKCVLFLRLGCWGLDFILIAGAAVEEGQTYVPKARNKSTDTLAFSRRWPFRRSISQPLCLPLSFCLPACPRPSSRRALEFRLISPNLPWLNVSITFVFAHTDGFN